MKLRFLVQTFGKEFIDSMYLTSKPEWPEKDLPSGWLRAT